MRQAALALGSTALAWGVSGIWLGFQPEARLAVAVGVGGIVLGILGSRKPGI